MKRRALIIGSGICGLATAVRLLENDPELDVTLLESEDQPGGLARSLTLDGHVADLGPHRIFTELPDVQEFLQDLAGEDMVTVKRTSQMFLQGSWIDYPPRPMEILRLLGPGKIAAVGASYAMRKARNIALGKSKRENFETVMADAFGEELYRLIVLGYTEKVWKIDPTEIHADIARVRVSAGGLDQMVKRVFIPEKKGQETALKKFLYIPGGVERLVDRLVERVEAAGGKIATGTRVTDLRRMNNGKWQVISEGPRGGRRTDSAEWVFSTMPVTELLDVLLARRPNDQVAEARRQMRFIANFLVAVVVDRPRVTENTWLYFPGPETIFNRGYEPKNFSPTMGSPNQTMLVLEITCHHGDKIWNSSDEELTRATLDGLEKTGLLKSSEIANTLVHRIPHTYPLYDLDYRRRLNFVWRYLARYPRLISVGRQGLFLHNNMDHSIHMGFRAADVVNEHPDDPQRHFYKEVRRFQKFRIVD
ncbi:FAD-dependent oxidoreductase [bacterium]|nr:FAD-dependent oxidoreductase [bacterium]